MDRNRIQFLRPSKLTPLRLAQTQSPKIKDSCDKCSSSKVRCTKEKPSCTRCDKLGSTCFYSPARRVGRPYRSKEPSSKEKNNEEPNRPPTKEAQKTRFVDESVKLYSNSDTTTSADGPTNSAILASTLQINYNQPETPLNTGQSDSNAITHRGNDPDCMLVCLDVLAELEVPAEQLRHTSSINAALLDTTAQIVTSALSRLSTVLICPCSERAELGMLVSAICMSIIDMHTLTIARFPRDQPSLAVPRESPGFVSRGPPEHEATILRVLEGLSEVATLTLKLAERYNNGIGSSSERIKTGSELPTESLPPMAAFLQERLQQVTSNTAYCLG